MSFEESDEKTPVECLECLPADYFTEKKLAIVREKAVSEKVVAEKVVTEK